MKKQPWYEKEADKVLSDLPPMEICLLSHLLARVRSSLKLAEERGYKRGVRAAANHAEESYMGGQVIGKTVLELLRPTKRKGGTK